MITTRRPAEQRPVPTLPVLAVVVGYLVALLVAISSGASYDVWGGVIVAPILVAITFPIVSRAARRQDDLRERNLILTALILKLVGSLVRYAVSFEVYERADATGYDTIGRQIAAAIRGGDFTPEIAGVGGSGTRFVQKLTGWVYAAIGPSKLGGFLVFSWLGFWGLYLFYRAFRKAFPQGDHRRYALLVFFLPSLLFWPSSIGKDAWMTFTLGITAYGAARLLTRQRGGLAIVALGLWATAAVRPHITVVVLAGLMAGILLRRPRHGSPLNSVTKAACLAVMLAAGLLLVARVESFFGVEGVDSQAAEAVFDETQRRSSQGDSAFESERVRSPLDLPGAVLAVLFRPFPTEVHNAQSAIASLEGLTLLVLCVRSGGRLGALPRHVLRAPYVAFAATFTALFIFAFSSVGNFGIIARQRVQVFPFVLVLLAVPVTTSAKAEDVRR